MAAYYNEIDPNAAAALRQLIADGVIASGDVDERSIKDVKAHDLRGYTQCHFFAGGGVWSVAARLAGWPDTRALWTGSCPCQPFSAAGKGAGVDDPRHLWPDLFRLVRDAAVAGYGPPILMGEQVSGAAGYNWFDGVRADLEAEGFAARTRDIPACAVDAPHERNRLYWVAVANSYIAQFQGQSSAGQQPIIQQDDRISQRNSDDDGAVADAKGIGGWREQSQWGPQGRASDGVSDASGLLADSDTSRLHGQRPRAPFATAGGFEGQAHQRERLWIDDRQHDGAGAMGNADNSGLSPSGAFADGEDRGQAGRAVAAADGGLRSINVEIADSGREQGRGLFRSGEGGGAYEQRPYDQPRRPNGSWWADAEWIECHDGKARRAKPGIPMLVNGLIGRMAAWRLVGNAISPILAAEVIGAFLDAEEATL